MMAAASLSTAFARPLGAALAPDVLFAIDVGGGEGDRNTALGFVIGAVFIGLSLVISSAIQG